MSASKITRDVWTNDSGTPAAPNGDGTSLNNNVLQNHIYARIDELFNGAGLYSTFTFGGLIAAEGFGLHTFAAGGTGSNLLLVQNVVAGAMNAAGMIFGNDASGSAASIIHTSSSYIAGGYIPQDGLSISGVRAGGVSVAAAHAAGTIRFYTGGGTERMRLEATGLVDVLTGNLTVRNTFGVYSQNTAGTLIPAMHVDAANNMTVGSDNAAGTNLLTIGSGHATVFRINSAERVRITNTGLVGINTIANPRMTIGLTVDQGINDNEILSLQSTDVAHSMTGLTEAKTWYCLKKYHATNGGAAAIGLSAVGATVAHELIGYATNEDPARTTAATAPVVVNVAIATGGGTVQAVSANQNLVAFRNNGSTRALIDSDGDLHLDGTSANNVWDDHHDLALLTGLRGLMTGHEMLTGFIDYARPVLERTGVVAFNDDGHHFVSMKGALGLTWDAMRQEAIRLRALLAVLTPEQRLAYRAQLAHQTLELEH